MGRKKRILWLDDDVYIIGSATHRLEEAGHNVEKYKTGVEAWRHLSGTKYDAIILDIILSSDSRYRHDSESYPYLGVDVLRDIRTSGQNKQTPVVVFSVVGNREVLQELESLGVPQ